MQGFVNNNEKLENKIRNFVDKKDACNGYGFCEGHYMLPELDKNIFEQKICSIKFDD